MVCNTKGKIRPPLLKSLTSVIIVIKIMVVLQDLRMKTKFQVSVVAGLTVFIQYIYPVLVSHWIFTESQNGRGWKGPLWVI